MGYIPLLGVQPLAGSPAITPSPFRGSGVICILSYLRLQYVTCCCDVGVEYFVQLRTLEQSSIYPDAAAVTMQWTSRRGACLINVDDADTILFGDFSNPPQQIPIGPDIDVIEVAVLLRNAFWTADFNRGYADIIEPLYGPLTLASI